MMDNSSWMTIYPEIVLLVMACVIALADLFVKSPKRTGTYVLTLASLAGVALLHAMYADAGLDAAHIVRAGVAVLASTRHALRA